MSLVLNHEFRCAVPVSVVWEVLTDLEHYGEWNPFCVSCRSTLKPGDPIDMVVKLRSKRQKQREWITDFAPGRRFAYGIRPAPMGALRSYRSHEVEALADGGTLYRSHFELAGWLVPLVLALFGQPLRAGFSGMTGSLRSRAEVLWGQRQSAAHGT